jgi:hypothetical protein
VPLIELGVVSLHIGLGPSDVGHHAQAWRQLLQVSEKYHVQGS